MTAMHLNILIENSYTIPLLLKLRLFTYNVYPFIFLISINYCASNHVDNENSSLFKFIFY